MRDMLMRTTVRLPGDSMHDRHGRSFTPRAGDVETPCSAPSTISSGPAAGRRSALGAPGLSPRGRAVVSYVQTSGSTHRKAWSGSPGLLERWLHRAPRSRASHRHLCGKLPKLRASYHHHHHINVARMAPWVGAIGMGGGHVTLSQTETRVQNDVIASHGHGGRRGDPRAVHCC